MAVDTIATHGFAALNAQLEALPNNIARAVTRRGGTRGADIMAAEQRTLAPEKMKGTIGITARARNLTGLADYAAVLRGGGSKQDAVQALRDARREGGSEGTRMTFVIGSTSPMAAWFERGTKPRHQKSGRYTGIMPAHPFVRPAWDMKWKQMLTAVRNEIQIEIGKSKVRIAKRAGF